MSNPSREMNGKGISGRDQRGEQVQLSIIIVNFNTGQHLSNCLHSLYGSEPDVPFEVILVDNASTDDSLKDVEEKYAGFGN